MRLVSASLALGLCLGSFVFADDANVLPEGVARLRVVPSLTTMGDNYDLDGKSVSSTAKDSTFTVLSGAFEFGITKAITAGLKWAPGYYLSSDLKNAGKAQFTGPADLEIGAKIMALGPTGLVPNEMFRVAFTPGISLPLDNYDAKSEFDNYSSGKEFRAASSSGHSSFGVGVKADADYLFSSMFYVNLHAQAFQYLPSESVQFLTYATNAAIAGVYGQAAADATEPLTKTKTTYGIEYAVELEPHATFDLGGGANVGLGVPVTYSVIPGSTETYNGTDTNNDAETNLVVKPYASLMVMLGAIPIEVLGEYDMMLSGTNTTVNNTLSAQIRLFYKFY